jgi:hypothetical protein
LNGGLTSVQGNLTITTSSIGSANTLRLNRQNDADPTTTLTVGGNFTLSGELLVYGGNGTANTGTRGTINVGGNLIGDSGARLSITSSGNASINFTGSGTQNYNYTGDFNDGTRLGGFAWTVNSGSTVNLNNNLNGNNLTSATSTNQAVDTLTVQNGATLNSGGYLISRLKTVTLSASSTLSGNVTNQIASGLTNIIYGSSFLLFSATNYSGWFSSLTLPTLSLGLSWDTNKLATTGVLDIYSFTTNAVQTMAVRINTPTSLLISKLLSKASGSRGTVVLSSVSSSSGASVSISGDHINYTPPTDFTGIDTFKAILTDGHAYITATVVVTVNAINASSSITAFVVNGDGSFTMTASGLPNQAYNIQAADTVSGPWGTIGTSTAAANGVVSYTDTDAPNHASRVYRLAQ